MSQIATALGVIFHPHDSLLVGVSIALAVFASYVSLELAGRIRVTAGAERLWWLALAAFAMGGGIWSQHFVAMVGLKLPFPAHFNHRLTALSLIVAVAVTGAGLYLAFGVKRRWRHYLLGGGIMGLGIAGMHYMGMGAMEYAAPTSYEPAVVVLSGAIAVAASTAALWLAANLRRQGPRIAAAVVMGCAVAGMHFAGMAAFICAALPGAPLYDAGAFEPLLDEGVAGITMALLFVGLGSAYFNERLGRVKKMTLAQFGVNAIAAADLDEVFFQALALTCETCGVPFAALKDIDTGSGQVRCLIANADGSLRETRLFDLETYSSQSLVRHPHRYSKPLQRMGLDPETKVQLGDLFGEYAEGGNLLVSNRATDNAVLMLRVFSDEERMFDDTDIAFLRDLGDLLAVFKSRDLAMQRVSLRDRALAAIAQGVSITDEQTLAKRVIYANPALLKMTGYTQDQMLAPKPPVLILPGSSPGMEERLALDRAKRRPTKFDGRMMRADSSNFACRVLASPIVNRAGELTHYVWINEDVTEAKRRNEKLREMQRSETLGQLTGGVAHEFNNLLAVVRSNAEDLRDDLKGQGLLHRQADMVVQAADRGAVLVQQLLTYSRKKETQPELMELDAMLSDFKALLERTLEADIKIDFIKTPALPAIKTDPALLEDALLNLALNGRDAMPQGGTLTIETRPAVLDAEYTKEFEGLLPGNYVEISVTDTGSGMTPEIVARAFDPFFTTKEVGQGTGLGLSMVYGFTKQSGGHARIYSEPGHGTTVKLYIPSADLRTPAAAADPTDGTMAAVRSGARVLLVEDNELLRQSVGEKLKRLGYHVTAAKDGPAALATIEEGAPIDLVFTDVIMPGMTGADLAREVQRRWPTTGILMTSGYTAAAVSGKVQMPLGIRLLSKPYTNAQLSEAVRDALNEAAV